MATIAHQAHGDEVGIAPVPRSRQVLVDVYSTAMSIQNLVPWASQRLLTIGICVFVLIVAWIVPLAQYESFLLLIGSAFVPLLGVLAADYFVLRGGHYDPEELLRPRAGRPRVNWPSVIVAFALHVALGRLAERRPAAATARS